MDIMIVAGEASGDVHAGALMREISKRLPNARFFGMGGQKMRDAGLETIYDSKEISVMGVAEVLPKLFRILGVLKGLSNLAQKRRPSFAILVDIPDFNLRLAKRLKRLAIPVAYYISPMIWASRAGRVRQIARDVDTMLCILPFEEELYRSKGVLAKYVGSPVLDHIPLPAPVSHFRETLGLEASRPTLALLPGSRENEISRLMPTLVAAAEQIAEARPGLQIVIPVAPSLDRARLGSYFEGRAVAPIFVDGSAAYAVGASDAAIVCSGTAALEAGLMLRPLVVVYKMSFLNRLLFKLFVKVSHISLVNLLAGREVVPELVQSECNPNRICETIIHLLQDRSANEAMVGNLAKIRESLGSPGASAHAADEIISLVKRLESNVVGARTIDVPSL